MFIHCKKTGEEYEITDREIGEKVECPCCGEKFVVDDSVFPEDVYTAALIRKTEAIALRNEPAQEIYQHGSEGEYAKLFDRAYDEDNADAQFELAKRLYDSHKEYELAAFWFGSAARHKHPDATYRLAECYQNGIGVRKNINRAVDVYRDAAKYGCLAAKALADRFDYAEYRGIDGGGKSTFAAVQRMIGADKKFEQYLCGKYNARAVMLFWADEPLPEWGTAKGASFIIGSFKSEQEVPRELLKEIEHLIGRRLSYSGRYVDAGLGGEERFLFCYRVWPTHEDEVADAVKTHHISDLLQQELDHESGEDTRRAITWRETIDANCPLCESEITLPTRLLGSKVRCSHCNGEFWAKGEGIMTTAERKVYRERKKWSDAAYNMEHTYLRPDGSTISALKVAFKMRWYETESLGVGDGWKYPWPGIYVRVGFEDVDDNSICSRLANVRAVLESGLGYWLRLTRIENEYNRFFGTFYVRQDRPCVKNDCIQIELYERENEVKEAPRGANRQVQNNPVVEARAPERERLEYLAYGEREASRNRFDFLEFLRKKYGVFGLHVYNDNPGDAFCKSHGFPDGFGIMVESTKAFSSEELSDFMKDLEKRFSRQMTFVKKIDSGVDEYCFVPSIPNQPIRNPLHSASQRMTSQHAATKNTNGKKRNDTMKQKPASAAPQHLGNCVDSEVTWEQILTVASGLFTHLGYKFLFDAVPNNKYAYRCLVYCGGSRAASDKCLCAIEELLHTMYLLPPNKHLAEQMIGAYYAVIKVNGGFAMEFNHVELIGVGPGDKNYKYTVGSYA